MNDLINPYQPPSTVDDRMVGTTRTIRVGVHEVTTVYISASIWTGIRTYTQDEEGNRGPTQRGPAEFKVGERESHSVRIEVDGVGRVDAYVDDTLVEGNLFSQLRIRIFFLVAVFVFTVAVLAGGFAILLLNVIES